MARATGKTVAPISAPPKNDAFTALLIVSVGALLAGIAMLAHVLSTYDWAVKP